MISLKSNIVPEKSDPAVAHVPVDEFVERLKKICAMVGNASALAKKAGISNSGLSRYLAGGDPSRKVLVSLALAAGVNLNWLATGEGPVEKSGEAARPGSLTMLPFLGALESPNDEVIPGRKKNLTSQAFCRYWLGSHGLDSKALAAMHIRGDSMSPTIRDEDLVLIDVTTKDIQDDKIYVIQDGHGLLVRRLQLEPGGQVRALCDNPTHREFAVSRGALEIVGRVVWRGALL